MKKVLFAILGVLVVAVVLVGVFAMQKANALTKSESKVASMTSEIVGLNANVADLTANLTAEQNKATSLQSDLDKSQADLKAANATIDSLNSSLKSTQNLNATLTQTVKKVTDPRHFTSVSELTDWLAKDDTNTKYSGQRPSQVSYILQVRALRDGFILPAEVSWTTGSSATYWCNIAVIDGNIYEVNAGSDGVTKSAVSISPLPSHPEALP